MVVSIIALLSTVILSSLNSSKAQGRDARRLQLVKQYQNALELYRSANGTYPQAGDGSTGIFYCLGESDGASCINGQGSGSTTFNAMLQKYIPGPPANLDSVGTNSNLHGLIYAYCYNNQLGSCQPPTLAGSYVIKWLMEAIPKCANGAQNGTYGGFPNCYYTPQ